MAPCWCYLFKILHYWWLLGGFSREMLCVVGLLAIRKHWLPDWSVCIEKVNMSEMKVVWENWVWVEQSCGLVYRMYRLLTFWAHPSAYLAGKISQWDKPKCILYVRSWNGPTQTINEAPFTKLQQFYLERFILNILLDSSNCLQFWFWLDILGFPFISCPYRAGSLEAWTSACILYLKCLHLNSDRIVLDEVSDPSTYPFCIMRSSGKP